LRVASSADVSPAPQKARNVGDGVVLAGKRAHFGSGW
jgi:hypothetical protein